jgi:putative tryptophan/tyrosine transport system substrate-binding protein
MRRRELGILLGCATLTLPRFGTAQLPVARVALLLNQLPPQIPPFWEAFVEALRTRGWEEGRNIEFTLRAAEGSEETYQKLAAELVALQPNIIIAANSQAIEATRQRTQTIPIVMIGPSDPLGAGFIASLARPGGNITGLTNQLGDTAEKQLQTLKEMRPGLSRIALLWNPDDAGSRLAAKAQLASGPQQGLIVEPIPIKTRQDLDVALAALARNPPEALLVHPTPIIFQHREAVVAFALRQRLPSFSASTGMARDGLLAGYAPDAVSVWRRAADFVDRILTGANPAEMPVEQPTKFELVINLKTARAIGLDVPPSLLARADEIIE